jgi:hypothetical protein
MHQYGRRLTVNAPTRRHKNLRHVILSVVRDYTSFDIGARWRRSGTSVTSLSGASHDVIGYIYHAMAISVCCPVSSPLSANSPSSLRVLREYELTGEDTGQHTEIAMT